MEEILKNNEEMIEMLSQLCISKVIKPSYPHPYNIGTRGVHATRMKPHTPCGKIQ